MEEQKFPSRSDRHKKKKTPSFINHSDLEETGNDAVEDTSIKETETLLTTEDDYHSNEQDMQMHATVQELLAELEKQESQAEEADEQEPLPEPSVPVAPVYKKRKKRRNLNPAAGFLLLFFMLISGAWCGYAAMNAILPDKPSYTGDNADQEMLDNVNLLLLGCDEREGDTAARADVIMVATIRPEEKQVSIFSIPRDTRVEMEGHGKDKINHAMAYGGIPLVQSSVENLLGIQIDHTVKVNFDGFINVIDALGGINIDVPCRMYKPLEDIDLLPGYQTLDGSEALAFVRWRGDGTGDYGRIERQQQFISAVTAKVKDMSLKQALDVAGAVMDSFIGEELWLHGVNYVEPDMAAIADIVDKMQHGEPEPAAPEDGQADGTVPADQTQS